MRKEKGKDIKDIAMKLELIHTQSPLDYFYLKGWIHCLLQKEDVIYTRKFRKFPE